MSLRLRTAPFLVAAAAFVAAWPAIAPPAAHPRSAAAEDNGPGFGFYEERSKKLLKASAAKVFDAAKTAKGNGLHQLAYEQFQRTLEYDPNFAEAREVLGWVRKDDKWVLDKEAADRVPKQNQRSEKESEESLQKKIDKWKEEVLRKVDEFIAAKFAELGDECVAKSFADQSRKAWEMALLHDKDNARARKGLGYKRLGKVWLTDKQDQARKDASKSEVLKEGSEWDEFFGVKLNKVVSGHFRFESPFPAEELTAYAQAAETAYAYYLSDFGMDPTQDVFGGERMEELILKEEAQWNKYVDAYVGDDKEFTRKMAGTGADLNRVITGHRQGSNATSRTDMVVHNVVHTLNQRVWKLSRHSWMDEGLAYYYTIKVLEQTLTHCVGHKPKPAYANENAGTEGVLKVFDDPLAWKAKVKELVRRKADIELRALTNQPLHALGFEDTVKAWCVATWLMDQDRDKFKELLLFMGEKGQTGESALQSVYEQGVEELDTAWRKFALKTY